MDQEVLKTENTKIQEKVMQLERAMSTIQQLSRGKNVWIFKVKDTTETNKDLYDSTVSTEIRQSQR